MIEKVELEIFFGSENINMNARLLRNARLEFIEITNNKLYNFSLKHALSVYPIDAVFSFIPKNACSSLRYSIAVANGFIDDISDINWIHKNNIAFMPTQRDVALAKYTFVVLRCPFTRVASSFFNQVVDGEIDFKDTQGKKLSINFNEFLSVIKSQNREHRNQHWRNQTDFLHYESYDEYFSLEKFSDAVSKLEGHGLKIFDTREALNHDLAGIDRIDGNFSKVKEFEIKQMKSQGQIPTYRSMYGNDEIELVNQIYQDDIELYIKQFGKENLLF